MESDLFRLLKWEPDKVIVVQSSKVMFDPDTSSIFGSENSQLKAKLRRDISREVISRCCSLEWQPNT